MPISIAKIYCRAPLKILAGSEKVRQMVAAKKTVGAEAFEEPANVCRECLGTGTVSQWSEIAYFEDRRPCGACDAGGAVQSKIAEIVKRARLEERLSGW